MIEKTYQEEWAEYEEDVRKYLNTHANAGWKHSDDPLELVNPTTGEFCLVYVASDDDFEHPASDYYVYEGLENWLMFSLDVDNRDEAMDQESKFKYIKYHVIISRSHKKLVVLDKANIKYCSDVGWSGCFFRYARRSNVVDL